MKAQNIIVTFDEKTGTYNYRSNGTRSGNKEMFHLTKLYNFGVIDKKLGKLTITKVNKTIKFNK